MLITEDNFQFLNDLSQNNNRDWFAENKEEYLKQHQDIIAFADDLLLKMNEHDVIETLNGKKSLYRIYRDVRFSKNKAPYKTHWAGGFKRASEARRGGYFFHIAPGNNSFVAGGFWAPNKEDLLRIRLEIEVDSDELRAIINAPEFESTFGSLQGEQLKTAPKGFDKNHPAIDLLRFKQFVITKPFNDSEVLSKDFSANVNHSFIKMRPFLDYMSDVLTTDKNGSSLI